MKRMVRALLAALTCAALPGVVLAAEPVLINVDADNPPFMFFSAGKAAGVYPAVISAVFARLDVPVRIDAKPWKRALIEIDHARAGLGGLYTTEERKLKYDFSEPILTENLAVYFNRNRPLNFRTIDDLRGRRVGVILGWSYGGAFDAARREGKVAVEEVSNDRANFLKLAAGRLDAVVAVEQAGKAIIAAEKLDNIEQGQTFLALNTVHLAFNKSAQQRGLLARFNSVLAGLKKEGLLDRIVADELHR